MYSMLKVTEGFNGVDLTHLAQYRVHWIALLNTEINFEFRKMRGNLLSCNYKVRCSECH
jgi:hypothetical protein